MLSKGKGQHSHLLMVCVKNRKKRKQDFSCISNTKDQTVIIATKLCLDLEPISKNVFVVCINFDVVRENTFRMIISKLKANSGNWSN